MTTCTPEKLIVDLRQAVLDAMDTRDNWRKLVIHPELNAMAVRGHLAQTGLINLLTAGANALTEARAEIAELTTAYNDLVKAEAKAYDDGHADAKRQAEAEITRLEARCGELCDAHEAQFIRAEAAEAERARLLHGDDGGPEV